MTLRVLSPGLLTTVQDLGRLGYERFGVPQSGAMDFFALRAANRLVGNPPGAAGLEFTLEPPVLRAGQDLLVAFAGRGYALAVQGRRAGAWRAAVAWRGEEIRFLAEGTGGWGYLAVLGGIDVPPVMGSRSTFLRGGFGGWQGRILHAGDVLPVGRGPVGERPGDWKQRAGRWLPPEMRPRYADVVEVLVVTGPQEDAFPEEALRTFLSAEYSITATSDRMGYRLAGPPLEHRAGADLLSEPLTWGAVQVPADGQPMVMMADRPTTGGYPKAATLATAALPLLAQAMPGSGRVRFTPVSVEAAQQQYRALMAGLEDGIEEEADENAYG